MLQIFMLPSKVDPLDLQKEDELLTMPWGCLRFVIVVFPDHTHLLFLHILLMEFSLFYRWKISHLRNWG